MRGIERKAIFKDLGALDRYLFTGHSVIMGNQPAAWQDDDRILGMAGLFNPCSIAAMKTIRVGNAGLPKAWT